MAKRFKGKNKHNSHILTHRKRKQQQQKNSNKSNVVDQDVYYINDNQNNSV
jgi:hypothetical protein